MAEGRLYLLQTTAYGWYAAMMTPIQIAIGILALIIALPGACNALVGLYDRFLAKPGAKPLALSGATRGIWAIRLWNIIGLVLLALVIGQIWFIPPPPSRDQQGVTDSLVKITKERDDLKQNLADTLRAKPEVARTTLPTVAEIPTSLRLQFNGSGERPQEIEAKNVEWTWNIYQTKTLQEKPPCINDTLSAPAISILGNCYSSFSTRYDVLTTNNWVLFLVFLQPISGKKEVKVDAHGATIPEWKSFSLSNRKTYIEFKGDITRLVLDISVAAIN